MNLYVVAVILGIVEGLTEFLPVSSTGHLIIAGHALGFTGDRADIYEVVIQAGAMIAVVSIYWQRILSLLRPSTVDTFSGLRGLVMLALTTAPALIVGLLTHSAIKQYLFRPSTVALALLVGAAGMWVVEGAARFVPVRVDSVDRMDVRTALGVGLMQCLALWPGMSRSASTIVGGMALGMGRKAAAEYSFLAALPIITAATIYDLIRGIRGGLLALDDAPLFAVGLVVSATSAWFAIRVFLRLLATGTLRPYAYYRVALAVLVLAFPQAFGPGGP